MISHPHAGNLQSPRLLHRQCFVPWSCDAEYLARELRHADAVDQPQFEQHLVARFGDRRDGAGESGDEPPFEGMASCLVQESQRIGVLMECLAAGVGHYPSSLFLEHPGRFGGRDRAIHQIIPSLFVLQVPAVVLGPFLLEVLQDGMRI